MGLNPEDVSERFLMTFVRRVTNRYLICRAYSGDAAALERLRVRIYKARLEARFWAYLRKTLRFEAQRWVRRARTTRGRELLAVILHNCLKYKARSCP